MQSQPIVGFPAFGPVASSGSVAPVMAQLVPSMSAAASAGFRQWQRTKRQKRQTGRPPKRANKKKTAPRALKDGTSSGTYVMTKKTGGKKQPKKTLKQQISQVKKLIPKKSSKIFRDFYTNCLPGGINEHILYEIDCFNKSTLEDYAKSLVDDEGKTADYSTTNSTIEMHRYYKYRMKNNTTANVSLSYCYFVCKDDDNESPVVCVREELIDRGYVNVPTQDDFKAATATASRLPRRLIFKGGLGINPNPFHAPGFTGAALRRNWRPIGGVKTAVMGPGDTHSAIFSDKYTYKQEYKDQENAFTYLKGMDVRLVISLKGDLSHDNVNKQLVGYSGFQVDAEEHRQTRVVYPNPRGLHDVDYTDNLTNTNFTDPVHADNYASAIEGAQI